jgi:DNA-binding NtrC family response regulator
MGTDKFRLLIVNDNPITLEMMRNIVRHHRDLTTEVVVLAASALEKIRNNPPYHIILTDLTTPYFTGIDVLKAARSKSPDTKVIVVTSWGNHQGIIDAIRSGVYDYLHKPFRPDELNLKLANATRHFKQRVQIVEQETQITAKDHEITRLEGRATEAEAELEQIRKRLRQYEPEEEVLDLDSAIARAAAEKGGKLHNYNLFRKLTDLGNLLDEKKITREEFQKLRKHLIDKAYQIPQVTNEL